MLTATVDDAAPRNLPESSWSTVTIQPARVLETSISTAAAALLSGVYLIVGQQRNCLALEERETAFQALPTQTILVGRFHLSLVLAC